MKFKNSTFFGAKHELPNGNFVVLSPAGPRAPHIDGFKARWFVSWGNIIDGPCYDDGDHAYAYYVDFKDALKDYTYEVECAEKMEEGETL